ncbi:MAG: hypothetical protein M1826_003192 [Phylliscum demangeonii]|nr:MAG: hypothetical protein M1826_003192 [Phylliscum demangeonii]
MTSAAKTDKDGQNRKQLQAILSVSITDCTPVVSLSAADDESPFEITVSARITWSAHPSRPLTLSTWRTPFNEPVDGLPYTGDSIAHAVRMQSATDPGQRLATLGRPHPSYRVHFKEPDGREDWRTQMAFMTVPSWASGQSVTVRRVLERRFLFPPADHDADALIPRPGDAFDLLLDADIVVAWWNWGDLERDLKEKKFVNWPDPRLNDRHDPPPPEPYLLPYACWEPPEDEDGNEMVYLDVEQDPAPRRIRFVE